MEEVKNRLKEAAQTILAEIDKETKVSHKRVRQAALAIAKARKEYRDLTLQADRKKA